MAKANKSTGRLSVADGFGRKKTRTLFLSIYSPKSPLVRHAQVPAYANHHQVGRLVNTGIEAREERDGDRGLLALEMLQALCLRTVRHNR